MRSRKRIDRRQFVQAAAGASASSLLISPVQSAVSAKSKRDNPVIAENAKAGTADWQLQYTSFDDPITLASYPMNRRVRSVAIEGYASKTSVLQGETLDLMVSQSPAGNYNVDIYRLGYYAGAGGRHMARLGPFKGKPQPMPMMSIERLRECAWEKGTTLSIPKDWPSGVYLAKLTCDEEFGVESYVIFVVKEHRKADLLVQTSDLTWQAYNKWPGKDSLYDDGTPEVWYTGPKVRVSFDRPYTKYCQVVDAPGTIGTGAYLLFEFPMAFWLEQQGYDVIYCSNTDLEMDPVLLDNAKVFLSVGHDEYWSRPMFEAALKARDRGLSLAFFSGDTMWYEILTYNSSVTGSPFRAFARNRDFGGEEQKLMGVKSGPNGYGDWIITKPRHWIYEGLGANEGDRIRGLVGWEYNWIPATDIPGLEVVASAPLTPRDTEWAKDQKHHAVVYPCKQGNWVFNAGTIWWPEGLSAPPGHIPARVAGMGGAFGVHPWVQRMTANVMDRMIKDSPRT